MKRYFLIALVTILVLAIGIVGYGTWLNSSSESVITQRMSERKMTLSGAVATRRDLLPVVRWKTVSLYSDVHTDVVAQVDGIVAETFVQRQQLISEGDPVMRVINEDVPIKLRQADGSLAKAQAELVRAERSYIRQYTLYQADATPKERLDEAEAYYLTAQASIAELEAQRNLYEVMEARQIVRAPITGRVLMLYRTPGTFVTGGTPVALMGDFTTLWFKSEIPDNMARYLLPLMQPKKVTFERTDFSKAYGTEFSRGNEGHGQEFSAWVQKISPPLSEPAEMRTVILGIDNASGVLEAQTYQDMYLKSATPVSALTVPLKAMTDASRESIYVLGADGKLELRKVEAGADDGTYVEILSGINEGDVVVTTRNAKLVAGMEVNVITDEQKQEKQEGGK